MDNLDVSRAIANLEYSLSHQDRPTDPLPLTVRRLQRVSSILRKCVADHGYCLVCEQNKTINNKWCEALNDACQEAMSAADEE